MSDLDNKEKKNETEPSGGVKIDFTPADGKDPTFVVKKTPDQIKIENAKVKAQASTIDINSNIGSFANIDEPNPLQQKVEIEEAQLGTTKVAVIEKIQEVTDKTVANTTDNDKDTKIDFAKFDRKKQSRIQTKLGTKLDIWLRNPKSLLKIWLLAIAVIAIIWTAQICYVIFVTGLLKNPTLNGLYNNVGVAGNVLSYISIGLPILPFIYLITTAIIGVNGVLSSRTFHYFLWSILIVAFACFLASTCCSGFFLSESQIHIHWS